MQQLGIVFYRRQPIERLRYRDAVGPWDRYGWAFIKGAHDENPFSILRDTEIGRIEDLRWSKLIPSICQTFEDSFAQRVKSGFEQTWYVFYAKGAWTEVDHQGDKYLQEEVAFILLITTSYDRKSLAGGAAEDGVELAVPSGTAGMVTPPAPCCSDPQMIGLDAADVAAQYLCEGEVDAVRSCVDRVILNSSEHVESCLLEA